MQRDPVALIHEIRRKLAAVATVEPSTRLGVGTTIELATMARMSDALVKRFGLTDRLDAADAVDRSSPTP